MAKIKNIGKKNFVHDFRLRQTFTLKSNQRSNFLMICNCTCAQVNDLLKNALELFKMMLWQK
jgi:hypothetical protein